VFYIAKFNLQPSGYHKVHTCNVYYNLQVVSIRVNDV